MAWKTPELYLYLCKCTLLNVQHFLTHSHTDSFADLLLADSQKTLTVMLKHTWCDVCASVLATRISACMALPAAPLLLFLLLL